jgi:hypothetical protein
VIYPGISIELFDGVGGQPVTSVIKAESDKFGRVRRDFIKNRMRLAWKGYKTHACMFLSLDNITPKTIPERLRALGSKYRSGLDMYACT